MFVRTVSVTQCAPLVRRWYAPTVVLAQFAPRPTVPIVQASDCADCARYVAYTACAAVGCSDGAAVGVAVVGRADGTAVFWQHLAKSHEKDSAGRDTAPHQRVRADGEIRNRRFFHF